MKRDILNNLKDMGRWLFRTVGSLILYVGALMVGLFLCYAFLMKIGSVVNGTSMLEEGRVTNIYDSIRKNSRKEDKKLAKELYNYRIESGYYEKEKN